VGNYACIYKLVASAYSVPKITHIGSSFTYWFHIGSSSSYRRFSRRHCLERFYA